MPFKGLPSPHRHLSDGYQHIKFLCRATATDAGVLHSGNYHFMPAFLTKLSPKRFGEGSTLQLLSVMIA